MRYRPLGKTSIKVSEIGFGAWGIGGASHGTISYGPTDDAESSRALQRALDLGVTFYDTADLYGHGHSERLLGAAFKAVRDRVVIASKVGFIDQSGGQDFSVAHIKKSLEQTLKRLQSDYLDLYQLHDPPIRRLQQDPSICAALGSLQQEGKIRAYGISVRSPGDGLIAVAELGFSVVQVNFNMADQRVIKNGLLNLCQSQCVGVICRTPLCFGFLTGKYPAETKFHGQDHRSRWSAKQIEVWANASPLFRSAISNKDQSETQAALRFCLSYPQISTVIPGMLTVTEVEENLAASDLGCLSQEELKEIEAIYKQHDFFLGAAGSNGKP